MTPATFTTLVTTGALGLLALVTAVAGVGLAAAFSSVARAWWGDIQRALGPPALWIATGMAAVATAGSLYYSEVAHFEPCRLCWYQRIAMYPLVVVIGLAALRGDRRGAHRYGLPLAAIGAGIASYHYTTQWFPSLESGACSATAPCSVAWVWRFGFVSIPLMALISFTVIITALLIRPRLPTRRAEPDVPEVSHVP